MAVSAYGPQGRLKKHALLGTSMLADPSRKEEVKQFRGLQQEAATSGDTSRKAGVKRLKQRYATFAAPHQQRLAAISEQQQALGAQTAAARDPAREQALTAKQKEYQTIADSLQGLSGKELKDATRTMTYEQGAAAEQYYQDQRTRNKAIEMGHTGTKLGKTPEGDDPIYDSNFEYQAAYDAGLVGPGPLNDEYLKNYYNWQLAETKKQSGSYEDVINAEIDQINQSFLPLEEERADRSKRLQDRADLYNMFLGQG